MPRKLTPERAELIARIVEDRKAGLTYEQIAKKHDVSKASASRWVRTWMEETIKEPTEDLIQLEIMRLDKYLKALDKGVEQGNPRSVEIALKVSERRAKLLGIDAPEKSEQVIEHHVKTQAEIELEAMLQEAYGLNRAQKMLEGSSPQNQEASSDA